MSDASTQTPPATGTFCWNELMTRDVAAAKKFYSELFGWTGNDMDMGPAGTYTIFKNGEQDVGGLMALPPAAGDAPPMWTSYVSVDDVDAAAAKCTGAGGNILHPPTDIPNMGRFSVMQDPTGAVFAVYKGTASC